MPKNALLHPDDLPQDLPLDLQLDLLVDGELSEHRRRELLALVQRQPDHWRTLAIRFLQHQTEKQSAKTLMAGGRIIPAELIAPQLPKSPVIGRIGWYRITGIAAAVAIAAGSSLLTLSLTKPNAAKPITPTNQVAAITEIQTSLPGDIVEAPSPVSLRVPLAAPTSDNNTVFTNTSSPRAGKTSFIIQSDGNGAYYVVPVSTSKTPVY